jgi:aminoglycoside 3-N-acetyltransferase I
MDAEIKKLDGANLPEFKQLLEVFTNEFEMNPGEMADDVILTKLLNSAGFIVFVSILHNKVVGGLTAYILPAYYGNYSEVYIYDIAVNQEHQRKGLGMMLIDSLKKYCAAHTIKTMFVEAEEKDTQAINFYHRTKAVALNVVHFNYEL